MCSRYCGKGIISGKEPSATNMKKVYINENKLPLIKEMRGEVTFQRFFDSLKGFLQGLLDSPINIDIDPFFMAHGINQDALMRQLLDKAIIKKNEKFKEVSDENGKKRSMHYVKYSIPRSGFEKKVHRLYSKLFESKINECDCGGCMGGGGMAAGGDGVSAGATNAAGVDTVGMGSGQVITPLFGVQRRSIYSPSTKKGKKKKKNTKKK